MLLRAQATEEAVKAAHAPRFLHLATHGFFLPEMALPEAPRGQGPGAAATPAERAALLERESPLLRSGIALAGFNRRQTGDDTGVLTALEAAGLDLYGTRLVVLSACETGLGEASTGEGVYGMRRALAMAGAESQVMSLWKVDTGRTRELMEAYYRRLERGAGRSEAMRAVQLAMLADPKTASPNLWAAFIVSGEWRTLDEEARLPELGRVTPGARGCACGQAGESCRATAPGGWWRSGSPRGAGAERGGVARAPENPPRRRWPATTSPQGCSFARRPGGQSPWHRAGYPMAHDDQFDFIAAAVVLAFSYVLSASEHSARDRLRLGPPRGARYDPDGRGDALRLPVFAGLGRQLARR